MEPPIWKKISLSKLGFPFPQNNQGEMFQKKKETTSLGSISLKLFFSKKNTRIQGLFNLHPGRTTWKNNSFKGDSHTIPISLGILIGIVWEAYHKGVPKNPTDSCQSVCHKVTKVTGLCSKVPMHQLYQLYTKIAYL